VISRDLENLRGMLQAVNLVQNDAFSSNALQEAFRIVR
jgi:hypothetical protein